jgi:hypothetical protein
MEHRQPLLDLIVEFFKSKISNQGDDMSIHACISNHKLEVLQLNTRVGATKSIFVSNLLHKHVAELLSLLHFSCCNLPLA